VFSLTRSLHFSVLEIHVVQFSMIKMRPSLDARILYLNISKLSSGFFKKISFFSIFQYFCHSAQKICFSFKNSVQKVHILLLTLYTRSGIIALALEV